MKKTLLFLFFLFSLQTSYAQSTSYFRHMLMNHMTPRMELKGLYPISSVAADGVAHYKFSYDEAGRVIEIINSHPATRGQHPLSDLGVYRVQIEYSEQTETRTYFDKNQDQTRNLREVAKEVYSYDGEGFKTGLSFYDEQDQPIESSWNIAKYEWKKREGDALVLEKRYDLQGNPQVLAPFFTLGATLIEYGENGLITAQYNLGEQKVGEQNTEEPYKTTAHSSGMASYHDVHDQHGNVILLLYRDIDGQLINAADGDFSSILLVRDHFGNKTESIGIDEKGKEVWHQIYDFDEKGNSLKKEQ